MLTLMSRATATAAAAVITLSAAGLATARAADFSSPPAYPAAPTYAPPVGYPPPPAYEAAPVEVVPVYPPPVYVVPPLAYPYVYQRYSYAPIYGGPIFAPRGRFWFHHRWQ